MVLWPIANQTSSRWQATSPQATKFYPTAGRPQCSRTVGHSQKESQCTTAECAQRLRSGGRLAGMRLVQSQRCLQRQPEYPPLLLPSLKPLPATP